MPQQDEPGGPQSAVQALFNAAVAACLALPVVTDPYVLFNRALNAQTNTSGANDVGTR